MLNKYTAHCDRSEWVPTTNSGTTTHSCVLLHRLNFLRPTTDLLYCVRMCVCVMHPKAPPSSTQIALTMLLLLFLFFGAFLHVLFFSFHWTWPIWTLERNDVSIWMCIYAYEFVFFSRCCLLLSFLLLLLCPFCAYVYASDTCRRHNRTYVGLFDSTTKAKWQVDKNAQSSLRRSQKTSTIYIRSILTQSPPYNEPKDNRTLDKAEEFC